MDRLPGKKLLLALVALCFMASLVKLQAADELMRWRKQDTMDTGFSIIDNKAGEDDILLELDVEDTGTYELTYYLEDGYQTYIQFVQAYTSLDIEYHINESNGAGGGSDVTQDAVSRSYLEINYDLQVPDWEFDADKEVGLSGGLEYSIPRSASAKYPGVAFDVDNKQLLIKWDFQNEKLYVLIRDYQNGSMMPVIYNTPHKGSETIKVLKQLEDFEVNPTHLITTDGAFNVELTPITMPNDDNQSPGSRPGLDITFKQPKELNPDTWAYDYSNVDMDDVTAIIELDDVGTDAYLDFKFKLQNDPDYKIYNIDTGGAVNDDVVYLYDLATHTYTVRIVKDKSPLAQQNTLIQWDELAASSIYDVSLGLEVELTSDAFDEYEFYNYTPVGDLGYTYLAYELQRSNAEEAVLNVTSYNAGDQDEIAYTVLYSKTIKETLDKDEDLWLQAYHSNTGENEEIFIPVPFRSTSSQDAYQIVVEFSGVEIYTQVLNYRAIDDDDVPPTTPTVEQVDNLFVVPSIEEEAVLPERVKFDLVWTAPTNKEIEELDTIFEDLDGLDNDWLYYEISVNDLPTDEATNPFEIIKVFRVKKEAGEYVVELYAPTPGSEIGSNTLNFTEGYNETDELFRVDDIIIREEDLWTQVLQTEIDDLNDTYTVTATGEEADITFPGINYLRVKAITIKDGEIANSSMSVPVSLSLSMQTYVLPTVDTLDYDPLYGSEVDKTAGVSLQWHSVDVDAYESNMLAPIGKTIEDMWYTVYIAEEKSSLLPLDADDSDYHQVAMDNDNLVTVGNPDETELTLLRNGEVLYFNLPVSKNQNTQYTVNVQGLDINREYYVRIVTKVNVNDEPDKGNPLIEKRSLPSDALGVTIPRTPGEPGDQEVFPLAPEAFTVGFADEGRSNALLEWLMPTEMSFEEDANGFEVIAIEDRALPDALKNNGLSLTDVLEDSELEDDVVEGWRIYVYDGDMHLKKYDPDTGTYEDLSLDLLGVAGYEFSMIDDANSPNKVNYYYVRTIKLTGEAVDGNSAWVSAALTTSPVQGPINLIVDYDTIYDYDPQEELVIRFDAPVPEVTRIGTDYVMEIFVKGEDDQDYSMTKYPTEFLGSDGDIVTGFERVSYLISDLKPGKAYDIKVRIEDRTQPQEVLPDGSSRYPRSAFSETVTSRTEFDQESYDKENKYYQYLDYYLTQAEKLKYIEYFRITNNSTETAVKYRENYATGLIHLNRGGEFRLVSENKAVNTYYLPSNSLSLLNEDNVTLVIETKDHQVGIRPDTIGEGISNEINDMLDDIQRYTSTDEDYYIRFKVYSDTFTGTVQGAKPTSELVELEMTVIGSKLTEEQMDERMVNLLDKVIVANESEVIAAIEEDLEKGIDDASLLEIVQDVLEEVEAEYVAQASILYKGYLSDNITEITTISKPVYVALTPEDTGVTHDVYTRTDSGWRFASASYLNNRYYVDNATLQSYITVAKGKSQVAEYYGQQAVDMINEYGLTTVFSDYDLGRPEEKIDKYQWINGVSRMLGARPGEDTAAYLTARGLDVSGSRLYEPIVMDEALYIYAQAFADKHGFDLKTVHISDYLAVRDLDKAGTAYRQTLLQAANLDIIPLNQGYMYPNETLVMDKALELLTILHYGLK